MRATGIGHEYRLFGLPMRSAIELPELDRCAHGATDAVEIRRGSVPAAGGEDPRHALRVTSDGAVLSVRGVARFGIRLGREIVVDADPAAADDNVRLFLLGSAMGALLHQRRLLPLHANAIEIDGQAVAILGASGSGKSTLAAAFCDRGRRVLSDDVCVVGFEDDRIIAQPGIPRLRLWRDAIERSGRDAAAYPRAFDTIDKYTVPVGRDRQAGARPLAALFLLVRQIDGALTAVERLDGTAAIAGVIENTYRGSFIASVGDARLHFENSLRLTRERPMFRLLRPWNATRIGETVALIEAECRRLLH